MKVRPMITVSTDERYRRQLPDLRLDVRPAPRDRGEVGGGLLRLAEYATGLSMLSTRHLPNHPSCRRLVGRPWAVGPDRPCP